MPEPIATWNRARGVWETQQTNLICGHSEPYLATWPRSGMTRGGVAYELPTPERRTAGNAGSVSPGLLPTPTAMDHLEPRSGEALEYVLRRGEPDGLPRSNTGNLRETVAMLRTPTAQLAVNGGSQHPDKRRVGGHGPTLADEVEHLLPTPRATDGTNGGPNQRGSSGDLMLPSAVTNLLPTPRASDTGTPGRRASDGFRPPLSQVLLPTPTARSQDRTPEEAARRHEPGRANGRGGGASPDLASVAALLPTPMAADGGLSRGQLGGGGAGGFGLRDVSREISRGETTSQPSAGGKPSPDGQLPGQLSLDELENG